MTWNKYFFDIVNVIKQKSKDIHTKVGCVIVGPDNEIRSTGYNSFPRGINDNVEERYSRENGRKYVFFEHSERNAIYNAARVGTPLKGCRIFMQGIPCVDCARAIIQAGIIEIIYDVDEWAKWTSPKYNEAHCKDSIDMLNEAGVKITPVKNDI